MTLVPLSTRAKLRIARLLYHAVRLGRGALGRPGRHVTCVRGGIRWRLDLSEGIDLSIFLLGRFEPATSRSIGRELRPGMVALDVGANIGAHTLPMAKAVLPGGRVHAFEATEWAFSRLRDNLALNPQLANAVTPVHALLGDGRSALPGEIHSSWSVLAFDRKDAPVHGGSPHPVGSAASLRLDEYADRLPGVDFIKMDIDGFEPIVLEGARGLLARHRPSMLIELCPNALLDQGSSLERLVSLLRDLGYRLRDEADRVELPGELSALERMIPRGGSINAFARPAATGPSVT